jgi:opacity protein-like surface antigen
MRHLLIAAGVTLVTMAGAANASAQARQWDGKGYVSANGGYQATANDFQDNVTFSAYAEQGDFDVAYKAEAGPVFDISGGVRVWRNLAVGAGVTSYRRTSAADVTARIPHPFFFDQRREAEGSVADVRREELAVHLDAMWMVPVTDRVSVAVFGGPSYFRLKQPIVTSLRYDDTYPYDTVTINGANTTATQENKVGYNAGADVMYMLTRTVGVGGVIRFTQAKFDLPSANNRTVSVDVGGAQAGAGVRFRF